MLRPAVAIPDLRECGTGAGVVDEVAHSGTCARGPTRHAVQLTGLRAARVGGALQLPAAAVPALCQRHVRAGGVDELSDDGAQALRRARHRRQVAALRGEWVGGALLRPSPPVPALRQRDLRGRVVGGVSGGDARLDGRARHAEELAGRVRAALSLPAPAVPALREHRGRAGVARRIPDSGARSSREA